MTGENFERQISSFLRFDPRLLVDGRLEVIVKYHGDVESLSEALGVDVERLNASYAIITGTTEQIRTLYSNELIEYVELPKTLTYELSNARYSACATRVQNSPFNLTGEGTAVGVIDSGIDYTHPDFQNDDGTSRILYIWDQTADGTPPSGFRSGAEYTNYMINDSLRSGQPLGTPEFRDQAGHGTAVAGVAAGNGRSSDGREKGIAPGASLIVVKLGARGFGAFPRTTEIMRALKYLIEKARAESLPLSVNLSYGTNNGPHDGNTLFEQYINDVSGEWKTVISVATGNEGSSGHHFSAQIEQNETLDVPFSVSGAQSKMYMTINKNFNDNMTFTLTSPGNESSVEMIPTQSLYLFTLSGTDITVFYGQPTNYTPYQEIYILFESRNVSVTEGIWNLRIRGTNIVDGQIDIWLPTVEDVSNETAFSFPDSDVTLTLPSTAARVVSVGGYNANGNTAAAFSGRGYTVNEIAVKPDVVAPAVNILTTRSGGGYARFTGTSIAAPFAAGSAALMMEWGIVKGNDPFLYGQRVKAFLQKGAKRTQNLTFPNNIWGYGTLCLSNTMDLLVSYNQGGLSV